MSEATTFSDDPAVLWQMICELKEQLAKSRRHEEQLQNKIDELTRKLYGRKSERIDPNQLALIDFAKLGLPEPAEEPEPEAPKERTKPRRRPKRQKLPENLPRRRVEHTLCESERLCPCCDKPMQPIREEVSERLDYHPAKLEVIEHVRFVYGCAEKCDEAIRTAPKPAELIEKGIPTAGLLTHVVICKYADHLPLHRLEGIFRRKGIHISRSTMCGWVAACAEAVGPIVEHLRLQAIGSHVLGTDDTTVCVLDPKVGSKTGRRWVYVGDEQHPIVLFDYTPTRSGAGPKAFLEGYSGFLQADGYSGYDALFEKGSMIEVGCWMHARRYFYDASQRKVGLALEALAMIGALYKVEREAKDKPPDDRLSMRQERSVEILDSFDEWVDKHSPGTLPKSPLGKAFTYYQNQRQALRRFLEDGRLPIDNGRSERAIRIVAIGRKNWMFAGSDEGGKRAAALYSLIATCKHNKIDPYRYLADIFQQLPTHPADRIAELTPLAWLEQQRQLAA